LVRNDQEINFNWGEGPPVEGFPSDDFSVRWIRRLEFEPGKYRLYARSDDGIRVFLDGERIIDEWHQSGGTEVYTADRTLTGSHVIRVQYYEDEGNAKVEFWWEKVGALNDPPEAVDDAYSVNEDGTLQVTAPGVLGNDVDMDGDPLTAVVESDVSNGSVTLNADGSFIYEPAPEFNGIDSFTYKANDGSADSNIATVTITVDSVDDEPIAAADSVTLEGDEPVDIDVLANDTGLGDGPVVVTIETLPLYGEVEVVDNRIRYTPSMPFAGIDTFTYTVTDADGDFSTATVTVVSEGVE
jgi:VCBS repeat-containing protein